jgi:prefoldin, archaeal alpha subunit/eukaryotic subunit 5
VIDMSETGEQRTVVTLEDLLAQAEALRREIEALQKLRDELTESLNSVKNAKEAINSLKTQSKDLMLSVDKRGFILLRVTEIPISKVLVNLGLGYYAEIEPDAATKILDSREEQLNKGIQEVSSRLNTVVNAYAQISEIINRAQEQAQKGE